MLTPEQIKGRIKNIAEKKDLRPQEVLQMFLFERVLERLSASEYKSNFILKGGLLISSMIGISERTTMDMDTTVRGIQMEEDEIVEIVKKIIAIDVDDGIQFEFQRIEPIREDDAYNNFRIHLIAKYGKINNPMKMDVTTGDVITPAAIRYDYPLILSEKTVSILAYSLETILAEKYETIIRRNIGTTRARVFMIYICFVGSTGMRSVLKYCMMQYNIRLKNVVHLKNCTIGKIFSKKLERNRSCTHSGEIMSQKTNMLRVWSSM